MATKSTAKKVMKKMVGDDERDNLQDLLSMKLRALLDVEGQLVKALPKMAKKATDPELAQGFEKHAEETKAHEERVKRALELLEEKPQKIASAAIKGMIADAEAGMRLITGDAGVDAFMAAEAYAVEGFEIANYECAIGWADLLGETEIKRLLEETLEEEKGAKETLATAAESKLNEQAMEVSKGGDESSEEEEEGGDE